MKKTLTTIAAATLMATSGMAMAEVELSGNVALTSNYIFRGVSQTDNSPTVQGGFDMAHSSGIYAGVWASGVDDDFFADSGTEIDVYAGFGGEFTGGVGYDVGVLAYRYPGTDFSDNNTEEVYGSLSYDFGPAAATLGLAYSSDFFGLEDATYTYLDVEVPLPNDFSLGLHYGTSDIDEGTDYDDWKVGLGKSFGGFDFALDYTDTDLKDDNLADDKIVFTISKSL